MCVLIKRCHECKNVYRIAMSRDSSHDSPTRKCGICSQKLIPVSDKEGEEERVHVCYIQPLPQSTEHAQNQIFYDFETFVDQDGLHLPFLVCTKTLGGPEWWFYGLDCVKKCLLYFRRPMIEGATFIAHNARAFNSYLVVKSMVELDLQPSIIMQGGKILCFTDSHYQLKFIDSLSFLTISLCDFPKCLSFTDQAKGYWFSSDEIMNYVGPYPQPFDYGTDRMTPAKQGGGVAVGTDKSARVLLI